MTRSPSDSKNYEKKVAMKAPSRASSAPFPPRSAAATRALTWHAAARASASHLPCLPERPAAESWAAGNRSLPLLVHDVGKYGRA